MTSLRTNQQSRPLRPHHLPIKEESIHQIKGSSCRKSLSNKKHSEYAQQPVLSGHNSRRQQSQKFELMTNRAVLMNIKKGSSNSSRQSLSIHPILLSQNSEHMQSLINQQASLGLQQGQFQQGIQKLFRISQQGSLESIIDGYIDILKKIDSRLSRAHRQSSASKMIVKRQSKQNVFEQQKVKEQQQRYVPKHHSQVQKMQEEIIEKQQKQAKQKVIAFDRV